MSKAIILVPYLNVIEEECSEGLRKLKDMGLEVWRRRGCSAVDVARSQMISESLHNGFDSMFFIDADISFDPADVERLLARPEPVVSGVYPQKGVRRLASVFQAGIEQVTFGVGAPDSYPLLYAATGFLRVKADVLRRMIAHFHVPLCDTKWGRGFWPFFMPTIVPQEDGGEGFHYLTEDWAFSHRLHLMGVTPLADTSIRLGHWGHYGYTWEDAGFGRAKFATFKYTIGK